MDDTLSLAALVCIQAACQSLGVSRASLYRPRPLLGPASLPLFPPPATPVPPPLLVGHSPSKTVNGARRASPGALPGSRPTTVHATVLDEGQYLCSVRTMYRLLDQHGESRERCGHLLHPAYQKPELLATDPNQLWSWDITKLRGPVKWSYFYLYVILDVFSRYVTGWMVAERESAELARRFLADTVRKYDIPSGQLNLHATDRSRVMCAPNPSLSCWPTWVSPNPTAPLPMFRGGASR